MDDAASSAIIACTNIAGIYSICRLAGRKGNSSSKQSEAQSKAYY
jgi:hypothetical protein